MHGVICDLCGVDYTDSEELGGMIFGSNGCCPVCTKDMMPEIKKYNEFEYIKMYAKNLETFAAMVNRYRRETGQQWIG